MTTEAPSPVPFPPRARDVLLAAHGVLPRAEQVEMLEQECGGGLERGYFSPEEETRIRALFVDFLQVRAALGDVILEARRQIPIFRRHLSREECKTFVPGWLAGCMVMRGSRYLIDRLQSQPEIRRMLNQADPVNGVPSGMFDRVDRTSTHLGYLSRFFWAMRIAESHAAEIAALKDDPDVAPLLPLLEGEEPFLERQKRAHAKAYANCRIGRLRQTPKFHLRRLSWNLFEASGRIIANCRNPFHHKRVRRQVLRQLAAELQPGDVVVTRHDDALSNWFLPGFWPHAALCVGDAKQRGALGLSQPVSTGPRMSFLEARKDGVRVRTLADTFSVDAFLVLRAKNLSDADQARLVERALRHEGKLYDFEFDFTRSDRMVCTEVVYRTLDGVAGLHFDLLRKAGRFTLPAEELIRQALDRQTFELILLYGVQGNQILRGLRARDVLLRTLAPAGAN